MSILVRFKTERDGWTMLKLEPRVWQQGQGGLILWIQF